MLHPYSSIFVLHLTSAFFILFTSVFILHPVSFFPLFLFVIEHPAFFIICATSLFFYFRSSSYICILHSVQSSFSLFQFSYFILYHTLFCFYSSLSTLHSSLFIPLNFSFISHFSSLLSYKFKLYRFLFLVLSGLSSQFDCLPNGAPLNCRPAGSPSTSQSPSQHFHTDGPFSSPAEPSFVGSEPRNHYEGSKVLFGIIPNNHNKIKCKSADGVFMKLRMTQPGPMLVTADNYAVGRLSRFANTYILRGLYQLDYGPYIRVKVHIENGHTLPLDAEEIHQFPEYHEFRVPITRPRQNRGHQNPRST